MTVREHKFAGLAAAAATKGGGCLSPAYVNARTRLEFKCSDPTHPSWMAYPRHILNGHWCPHCRAKGNTLDIAGREFGKLTAVEWVRGRRSGWRCSCECGGSVIVRTDLLLSGHTRSCGCLQPSHTLPSGIAAARRRFRGYEVDAHRRGIDFSLTLEHFLSLAQDDCFYCGAPPGNEYQRSRENGSFVYSGLDRLDSDGPYDVSNVVACCKVCNRAKSDMGLDEFRVWIERLTKFRAGRPLDRSALPGYSPFHCCGLFCDGQDGGGSQCAREHLEGPPSIVDRLSELADGRDDAQLPSSTA